MKKGKIKNYFPGGNSPEGFFSYYKYLPYKTKRTFIIKGGPGTGKSTFMKKIGITLTEKGYDIEYHWCSSDNNSLDGVVIPKLEIAIFDGTAPHMFDPDYPGAVDEIINVGAFWDTQLLQKNQQEIVNYTNQIKKRFQQVYRHLNAAKIIYDDWKDNFISKLNFDKVNQKANEILAGIPMKKNVIKGAERHLFGSALTPEGPVDFFNNLTEDIDNLYYIKGQPGTGKSTLVKKIAQQINQNGYFVLYLHRPLEPERLDGIIIPELNTAIITTSPPFEIVLFSEIKVINMMECLNSVIHKQEEYYQREIAETVILFEKLISQANRYLKLAKKTHDDLEEFYINAMDFEGLEEMRKEFIKKILP